MKKSTKKDVLTGAALVSAYGRLTINLDDEGFVGATTVTNTSTVMMTEVGRNLILVPTLNWKINSGKPMVSSGKSQQKR